MIIKNAKVFSVGENFIDKDICITNDRFTKSADENDTIIDATGLYAIPGLVDVHFHGCVGYDFCDGTNEAIQAIAKYEASNGVAAICPATMTLDDETLEKIFKTAAAYKNAEGSAFVGIHMEGPYLSMAKKGAQNGAFLHTPDISHFRDMQDFADGLIKIVSIAPEEDGAMELIKELKDEVVISVAHTTADYDIAMEAFNNGASHVTHLYNAMPPFTHRAPGVIGAAADAQKCSVELICDGVHIHPSVIRATLKLFGSDNVIFISDSMMATGMEDGSYSLGGQAVNVTGNLATLADGTIAGSATNLMKCMTTAVSFGVSLATAVKCASVNPAKEIGIYKDYGSIDVGKYANVVLLNEDLTINTVILKGQILK